jgi:hypothetical protein
MILQNFKSIFHALKWVFVSSKGQKSTIGIEGLDCFLKIGLVGYKNPSFYVDSKNVTLS